MSRESLFVASLRGIASSAAARGLLDDAAVLEVGGASLVLTKDMIVEGVHFLPGDPPTDVAHKLVAVNLSDLAAKGARPIGVLLGYSLGTAEWDAGFAEGLRGACERFSVPLLGGDTVAPPAGTARSFSLTAIGEASFTPVPSRGGTQAGDALFVTGTIGDAGVGLRIANGESGGDQWLLDRYRRPQPRLEAGQRLAPAAHAMMDVSDGLLIDAMRMAEASGRAVIVELDRVPLSPAFIAALGQGLEARLAAATAGDDYELLLAAEPALEDPDVTCIGRFAEDSGLTLTYGGEVVPLPARLGYEHGGHSA